MPDDPKIPFVFVPEGAPVPDAVRGPEWLRIPATFVPRGDGRATPSGQPWPKDRAGRGWAKDRFGRPICPLTEMAPGVRAPGEGVAAGSDPVAAFMASEAAFRDPAGGGGTGATGSGGRAGQRLRECAEWTRCAGRAGPGQAMAVADAGTETAGV